ncbi:MAG: ribonuclease HII [SAR324 cluster bacterium]|nr:ribonuclease HII [SAR324 cluster bacterium]MCZ6532081.1 ribonuclease HII [SAR324 cluster bacterium]MCZ6559180.1 ribonuclease HII [SAR324 cluster bacterium]MCZ6629505.1 ribonuclease HII [SAR324 cluster bacterium]MCZ6730281.1 ribonuclease HII [SAR324 cluster bacterium]
MPDFGLEAALWEKGFRRVAGVDEAGRGPLAGPVVVAAVVLPACWHCEVPLDDSKRMTPEAREAAFAHVRREALAWRMTVVPPQEIDRVNILQATLAGMCHTVACMQPAPDFVLVDGNRAPELDVPCETVVKGDARSMSIAAASVLAKVARDRIMRVYAIRYPQWGFERHKGYGTRMHMEAISRHGRSPIHRFSFRVRRVE